MMLRGTTGADKIVSSVSEHWDYKSDRNPNWVFLNNHYPLLSYNFKATWGDNTPGYHKKLKTGALLPHVAFEQFEGNASAGGHWDVGISYKSGATYRDSVRGQYTMNSVQSSFLTIENLRNIALRYSADPYVQKAAAKIYSGGWDALTFLAELHKTIDLFRGFVKRLCYLLSHPTNWTKIWLEGRYGWRLLYFDMLDIENAIQNLNRKRLRFSERQGISFSESNVTDSTTDFSVWRVKTSVTTTTRVSVRGAVTADIQPPVIMFNPIVTAWELITYSFVIDWVINIGQMLESWSFLVIAVNYSASGGIFIDHKVETTSSNVASNVPASVGTASGSVSSWSFGEYLYTRRTPTSVSTLPHFALNLDAFKVGDLLALIYEAAKRR